MAMPDFLLIGAPKAGSTALHVALARHPEIYMSKIKEPKFFLTDGPPPRRGGPGDAKTFREHVWRRADYEKLFAGAPPEAHKGESTTLYLGSRAAQIRIADTLPAARLIAVLRDPVDRAHSNWSHLYSAGLEPESNFLAACELEADRLAKGWAPFWGYTTLGRYGEQLTNLFRFFDREQVLILAYRDLRNEPAKTLDRVCRHIGVEAGIVTEIPVENVTPEVGSSLINRTLQTALRFGSTVSETVGVGLPKPVGDRVSGPLLRLLQREQRPRTPLSREDHQALIPKFEDDIKVLESLLDQSFDHWRDPFNASSRSELSVSGRFGTGFRSIDRPI